MNKSKYYVTGVNQHGFNTLLWFNNIIRLKKYGGKLTNPRYYDNYTNKEITEQELEYATK